MAKRTRAHAHVEEVVIIGSGVAGLTAAIYTARAGLNPLVIVGPSEGGQLTLTNNIENYPGFPEGVKGGELMKNMRAQAERFGARFETGIVYGFNPGKIHRLELHDKRKIRAKAIIIATGASPRWLGIPSEAQYKGRGVSTCATCDGYFFSGKEVLVVGGGNIAMEEVKILSRLVKKITLIHRRDELRAAKILQDEFFKNKKASVIWDSVIEEILGDGERVTGARIKNLKTGKTKVIACDGIFSAIGYLPNAGIFVKRLRIDENGYIAADRRMRTSRKGVFAAGDVQDSSYRQAITAAGSGCMAALEAERYLRSLED